MIVLQAGAESHNDVDTVTTYLHAVEYWDTSYLDLSVHARIERMNSLSLSFLCYRFVELNFLFNFIIFITTKVH
jgi:hypothetical protein